MCTHTYPCVYLFFYLHIHLLMYWSWACGRQQCIRVSSPWLQSWLSWSAQCSSAVTREKNQSWIKKNKMFWAGMIGKTHQRGKNRRYSNEMFLNWYSLCKGMNHCIDHENRYRCKWVLLVLCSIFILLSACIQICIVWCVLQIVSNCMQF